MRIFILYFAFLWVYPDYYTWPHLKQCWFWCTICFRKQMPGVFHTKNSSKLAFSKAPVHSHTRAALTWRLRVERWRVDWSLGACRVISGWSTGDLRPAPYFPLSSRMAIHGAGGRDYSDGALHPPAIFRRCERWRLISLWNKTSEPLALVSERSGTASGFMFGLFSLASSAQSTSHVLPSFTVPLSLSLCLSTDREDQSILCTWVKTQFSITLYCNDFKADDFFYQKNQYFYPKKPPSKYSHLRCRTWWISGAFA